MASAVVDEIEMPAFDVVLDRAMSLNGSNGRLPLVLCESSGLSLVREFHRALGIALIKSGLSRHVRKQIKPHMTLLYHERRIAEHPIEPVSWTANEFVLIRSLHGQTKHIELGRWPLRS